MNSGTAGLHLCVRAAGIGDGDLVITTPFSFVASANVLLFERAVPIFVDVEPRTGNIDPYLVKAAAQDIAQGGRAAQAWQPRKGVNPDAPLKAVLPVDVFGQPADHDFINQTARQYSLTVIENSCEALGATYKGRQAGTLGDFGVFGFYPNKQITTGEGGMIITEDDEAAAMMRALRNQGRAPGDTWLQHTHLGYNYRLDELSAALGAIQMQRLDEMIEKRARVAEWYNQRISEIPGVETPLIAPGTTQGELVCLRGAFRPRPGPGRYCPGIGEDGHPGTTVFPAHSPATLHGRALRLPARRLPGHRRPGAARPGAALLRRDG